MSAEVTFVSIRKEDYCPWQDFPLGGNSMRDAVDYVMNRYSFRFADSDVAGRSVLKFDDCHCAKVFLVELALDDDVSDDNCRKVIELIDSLGDEFVYFIVIDC